MRADFLAQAALYTPLAEIVSDHQFLVSPLDEADTRRVIEAPAQSVGLRFEDGLVERILREFGNEPGALPLLEDALLQLFEHRKDAVLTQQAYEQIGGVQGALAKRADDLYQQFTPEQQAIARRILLRLTQPGEGTADTRRRAAKRELWSQAEEQPIAEQVIETFTNARLLTVNQETDASEQVDVAHEALIRGWPRLGRWISEDRAGLRLHRRLTEAATEWQRERRSEDFLYRRARLAQAVEWREVNETSLNELERAFLDASIAREKRADEEEKERQQEREEQLRRIAEQQTARAALQRRVTWGLSTAALLVLALLVWIVMQTREVGLQTSLVLTSGAEAGADEKRFDQSLRLGVLAARASWLQPAHATAAPVLARAADASTLRALFVDHTGSVISASFSPDGKRVVTASKDKTARVWDVFWSSLVRPEN